MTLKSLKKIAILLQKFSPFLLRTLHYLCLFNRKKTIARKICRWFDLNDQAVGTGILKRHMLKRTLQLINLGFNVILGDVTYHFLLCRIDHGWAVRPWQNLFGRIIMIWVHILEITLLVEEIAIALIHVLRRRHFW